VVRFELLDQVPESGAVVQVADMTKFMNQYMVDEVRFKKK